MAASVFYYLRNGKSKQETQIVLGFRCTDGYMAYYLPISILPKNWDAAKKRIKNVSEAVNRNEINNLLTDLENHVNDAVQLVRIAKRQIFKSEVSSICKTYFAVEAQTDKIYFSDFVAEIVTDAKSGKRLFKGKRLVKKSVEAYKLALHNIIEYEGKNRVELSSVNASYFEEFTNFLTNTKRYQINTVGQRQKKIKVFLKEARKLGLHNDPFIFDVKAVNATTKSVYLTESELAIIQRFDFRNEPKLERVRDLLLIGCNTGLRVSDWHQINAKNIKLTENGNKYLQIVQTKTNTELFTPIFEIVETILNKYDYKLPVISGQKFNDYIKEVCRICEINEWVTVPKTIGGRSLHEQKQKWQLVSSHTCRRSFATNMKLKGYDSRVIMAALGQKAENTFNKYVKLEGLDYINMFFAGKPN